MIRRIFCLTTVLLTVTLCSYGNSWYVNDGSTTGDVFTSAVGNDANPGTAALPFATIQFAITAAATGDTIYVDAGTYNSGDVNITKSLTLLGAKFGIPAGPSLTLPGNRGTDESIIENGVYFGQSRDNITVDGFTVNIGLQLRGIEARGLNSKIVNNIVTGIPNPLVQQAGISTRANGPLRLHSYLIQYNRVTSLRFGIYFDGNLENPSEISENYVGDCFTTGFVVTGSDGHLYRRNVSNNNSQGFNIIRGNISILENTITNNALIGIRLPGTSFTSNNLIQNNFITGNGVGIALTDPNPASVNNQAHFNSFTGNGANIASDHAANFDATCNWLESTNPLVIAATITGPVTFTPFLTDGIDSDLGTPGFQPITTCTVVPVILESFTGQAKERSAMLSWRTSSEYNSSHFILERSIDNVQFFEVTRMRAAGYSTQSLRYDYEDLKPAFDRPVYYRLRMVDLDGTYSLSRVVRLQLNSTGDFVQQIFPNPVAAGEVLKIDYVSAQSGYMQLQLVTPAGQTLQTIRVNLVKGSNRINLTVPRTNSGSYFLVGRNDEGLRFRTAVQVIQK